MDLAKETELATAMLNAFGMSAFQRASDFAHIESLRCNEAAVAFWRRIMVLIRDLSAPRQKNNDPDSIDTASPSPRRA